MPADNPTKFRTNRMMVIYVTAALQKAMSQDGAATPAWSDDKTDAILKELREFRCDRKQLDSISEEIKKRNMRMAEAEDQVTKVEERIQHTDDIMSEMLKLPAQFDDNMTDQQSPG